MGSRGLTAARACEIVVPRVQMFISCSDKSAKMIVYM